MKYKCIYFIVGLGIMILAFLVPGCATSKFNNIEDVFISKAYTYEDGDQLVILGQVKRDYRNCCDSARGHIDIAILTPDGIVIDAFSVLYSPGNIPKIRNRTSGFKIKRPYLLPDGIVIRMVYHNSLEKAYMAQNSGDLFQCEHNKATPQYNDGQYKDIITKTQRASAQKVLNFNIPNL